MNHQTIASLVETNMKTIFSYALNRVSGKEEAEDLAGDIILAVLQSAPRLKNEDAFYGWFWAIAANTTKKYFRKKSGFPVFELDESYSEDEDVAETVAGREEIAVLRSTIFHRTVGLMGKLAMDTGTMKQPDDDLPAAVFLFETKYMEVGMKSDCCN